VQISAKKERKNGNKMEILHQQSFLIRSGICENFPELSGKLLRLWPSEPSLSLLSKYMVPK
jgi:hypothetical protein